LALSPPKPALVTISIETEAQSTCGQVASYSSTSLEKELVSNVAKDPRVGIDTITSANSITSSSIIYIDLG